VLVFGSLRVKVEVSSQDGNLSGGQFDNEMAGISELLSVDVAWEVNREYSDRNILNCCLSNNEGAV